LYLEYRLLFFNNKFDQICTLLLHFTMIEKLD
jgi:hypothetical protein